MSKLADSDPEQVRQSLLRIIAVAGLMHVVPAHAGGAYEGIPHLPERWEDSGDAGPVSGS